MLENLINFITTAFEEIVTALGNLSGDLFGDNWTPQTDS